MKERFGLESLSEEDILLDDFSVNLHAWVKENGTGIKAMNGCNVSHSKRHTKRTFDVNLFKKKFYYVEQDCWIRLTLSANGLKTINKKGLDAALNDAVAKGYCEWKDIKIIG